MKTHVHDNSLAAYRDPANARVLHGRALAVYETVKHHGPMTDRQVLARLFPGRDDANLVRPRLTELVKAGLLTEVGDQVDSDTGLTVRLLDVVREPMTDLFGMVDPLRGAGTL